MPHSELLRRSVSAAMQENIEIYQTILNAKLNNDIIFRKYDADGQHFCAIYIEGLSDDRRISDYALRAIKSVQDVRPMPQGEALVHLVNDSLVEIAQSKPVSENKEIITAILSGMGCLLIDGCTEALVMETRSYAHRGVEKPTNESVVIGPHEAFNEHLRTNVSLIRRYVQSPSFVAEKITIGTKIPTQLMLVYLEGVANDACIQEARRRLMSITAPRVMGCGDVQQLIEDRPMALLPQMLQTERPDRAASCVEDGQFAILVENSPYALVAPVTFFHLVHAPDDSYLRWQYGTALRIIRLIGLLLSLILPSLYVALSLYHTHLIPMALLTSIAESRVNVPFTILAEVIFMEFSFYLLNEAGLRTPSQIGAAFGIVGALILGQAAVSASIISPILIIIIAVTGLGNYVIPNYSLGIGLILYRLGLILLSGMMGLYGLMIGLFLIAAQVCSLKSFGVSYLAPIAPSRRHNPDILLRLPVWMQRRAMFFALRDSWMHQKEDAL